MSVFGPNASAAFSRSVDRARKVLKSGDRVRVDKTTVTFAHWGWLEQPDATCDYFAGRSVDELHPYNITAVNGRPVSFRDPRGEAEVAADISMFRAVKVQRRRQAFRLIGTTDQ